MQPFHLAQVNIARMLAPLDDPVMAGFVARLDDLRQYAYRSAHAQLIGRRKDWFNKLEMAYLALWWVPAGHIPTVEEAKQRLEHLRAHGETAEAFTFKKTFAQPEAEVGSRRSEVREDMRVQR